MGSSGYLYDGGGGYIYKPPGGGGLTAPVAADDVKHRYMIGGWQVLNKTTNSTQNATVNGNFSVPSARAINIMRYAYHTGNVPTAGSALLCEVSVNGGSDWVQFASIPVATINVTGDVTGAPIAAADNADIRVRFISDASWTSTTSDPQVWFEVEEQ